jgi:hypothetical protein
VCRFVDYLWSDGIMAQPLSSPREMPVALQPSRRIAQAIVTGAAVGSVVVVLAALGLWFHYGTTVFFETIAAGLSACF